MINNIIILLFTIIIMVTQSILLLNEEFLILLCFITFVLLTLNTSSNTLNTTFKIQSTQLENLLKNSLNQILEVLHKIKALKDYSNYVLNQFAELRIYYHKLIHELTNFIPGYNKFVKQTSYQKRLLFLSKVEAQTIKLLVVVLLEKLIKVVKTKKFYKHTIKSPQFSSSELISLRERIRLINTKTT